MRSVLVPLAAVTYLGAIVATAAFSCSKYDSNMGATFDLTDLVRYIIYFTFKFICC